VNSNQQQQTFGNFPQQQQQQQQSFVNQQTLPVQSNNTNGYNSFNQNGQIPSNNGQNGGMSKQSIMDLFSAPTTNSLPPMNSTMNLANGNNSNGNNSTGNAPKGNYNVILEPAYGNRPINVSNTPMVNYAGNSSLLMYNNNNNPNSMSNMSNINYGARPMVNNMNVGYQSNGYQSGYQSQPTGFGNNRYN